MRKLLLVLLVANVLLFGIGFYIETRESAVAEPPPLPKGAVSLRLIKEQRALPAKQAASTGQIQLSATTRTPAYDVNADEPGQAAVPAAAVGPSMPPRSAVSPATPSSAGPTPPVSAVPQVTVPAPSPAAPKPTPPLSAAKPAALAPAVAVTPTAKPPVARVCFNIGPFASRTDMQGAQQQLVAAGFNTAPRRVERQERYGYWVYLPPAASYEAAQATTRQLAQLGVSDFFIVLASAKKNAVSLGVFRDRKLAEARRDRMAALGFKPVMEDRNRAIESWWLDYSGDKSLPAPVWTGVVRNFSGITRTNTTCK